MAYLECLPLRELKILQYDEICKKKVRIEAQVPIESALVSCKPIHNHLNSQTRSRIALLLTI